MINQNVEVVRGVYDAFANGNVPAVLAAMDAKIEWNEAENFPYADGNPYTGPDAVVEGVFQRLGDEWEYWSLSPEHFFETGSDVVVVLGRYNAKYNKTGGKLDAQFAHVWWLRNGKAVRFQQYTDTDQAARVVQGK